MSIVTSDRGFVRAGSEPSWQTELRNAVRDAGELCRRLGLPPELAQQAAPGAEQFPVFVPEPFLARIEPGKADDPLLRQVLPVEAEGDVAAGFAYDPVDDAGSQVVPGLLHKYEGRALLITAGICAVHCRYCFRRHYPYEMAAHNDGDWDMALAAIEADRSIHEVILSGGDPLMLVDRRLDRLVGRISRLTHVTRLRVHTRLPIMIPSRINDELLAWVTRGRLTPVMVIHANHARELDSAVAQACDQLRRAGVMLLNQAVLLAGVNDSVEAQCELSERLIALGVSPYYLHQLDRVVGAAHFETTEQLGRSIVAEMRARMPGYAVPRYVREEPGARSKTWL